MIYRHRKTGVQVDTKSEVVSPDWELIAPPETKPAEDAAEKPKKAAKSAKK